MEMEEGPSIYERLLSIEKKQVNIPKAQQPNPNNSHVIKRWTMTKVDRLAKLEEVNMDKASQLLVDVSTPSYYYNSNKVNETMFKYQPNPKQWKGEKGVKEGKRTRAVKPGKVVIK
ncbi:hypothetical protein EHI8A_037690 [Entamoeba histolytica HM-1:IMSS-B]|uniref:Uncharacterized protein n=6 Tax=Entamoeba histolytica TaxID=5759 RepID=C4LWL3_ENTH1|nr:hypothetical protein EHI_069250 [Entamoeba histolytica HM-1:IMSS]EMD43210.1 Hypothetical protein EHI5A_046180 [Entamoeba histolytica KU27]EMH74184.1 hypothetical protein EHI8A_037690 [Entamoeba histolytica HM-1:IMSS-B]EMS14100.1 hypothetical protein KM1_062320 [Entamoeba histolytica HM-3:IMSS]ENY62727.1 hypothetical protein EHI7A_028090 [Entamoeba histolytica HM-1:IMSS-A]GAT93102.1 hypothetical protein CL6EHI_069250 [Entamoeba histolytica]|eukprot:XP_655306.2 hypothetical protein EHI_069250 [Entamoeba histolytica HM-1:IMSS]